MQPAISSIAPFTHRGLRRTGMVMPMRRALPAVFGLLALGAVPSVHAQPRETPVTCTNPVSGTNWQIRIDYDKGTVDSNPARISDTQISEDDVRRVMLATRVPRRQSRAGLQRGPSLGRPDRRTPWRS